MMGLAAVAAIGALLYMRKKTDGAAVAGAGAVTSSATKPASWTSALAGLLAGAGRNSAPVSSVAGAAKPAVVDASASAPVVVSTKPLQVPTPQPVAVFGGTVPGAPQAAPVTETSSAYTFGHLTPEQRGGKTDGQLALSIMGY